MLIIVRDIITASSLQIESPGSLELVAGSKDYIVYN